MKPIPDVEIVGTVTRFGIEIDSTECAVLVAYSESDSGEIGRAWLRFDVGSTQALKTKISKL